MDDSVKLPQSSGGILIGGINSKKKPPRLKSADRTISVAIENYLPQKPSSLSSSSLLIDNSPIIIDDPAAILTTKTSNHHLLRRQQSSILQLPPTVITQSSSSQSLSTANKHLLSEQYNPNDRDNKIFYLDEMGCPHLRKSSFRRSDTLDVQNPNGYLLRKTHSFHHTNDDAIDDYIATNNDYRDHLLVSRSTTNNSNSNNSINTAKLRQNFLLSQQMNQTFDEQSPQTRRNCRMHRSFVDHHNSNDNSNLRLGGSSNASNLNAKKDAIKCRSFNDEIYIDPTHLLQQAQSKIKFNSANVSIENDLYRSHNLSIDNSNNDLYMDYQMKQHGGQPLVGVTGTASSSSINKKYLLNRGNTMENFMIDPKTQFKRSQRNTNSFYMNHSNNQSDDLQHILNKSQSQTTGSSSRLFDTAQNIRRLHSASLKFRNNKENLMIQAKKSKSFITDIGYPANSFDSTNTTALTTSMQSFGGGGVSIASSSNRRDSNTLFPSDDGFHNIKKSPIRRIDHNIHHQKLSYDLDDLDHIERSPIIQSPLIDHHNDYNHMVRNFRHQSLKLQQHHQRKNSIGTLGTAAGALNTNLRRKSTKKKKSSLTLSQSNSSNLSNSNTNNDITDPDLDNNSISNSLKLNKKILDSDKTLTDTDINNDNNNDNKRKRKKIVCIIMTVFLSLVFASVFVVVITLTHSTVAQVHNHTRKHYTFSRDSPIHYNGII